MSTPNYASYEEAVEAAWAEYYATEAVLNAQLEVAADKRKALVAEAKKRLRPGGRS